MKLIIQNPHENFKREEHKRLLCYLEGKKNNKREVSKHVWLGKEIPGKFRGSIKHLGSKANIFSCLQIFFPWHTPSCLSPTIHFVSMPFLTKKVWYENETKENFEGIRLTICSKAGWLTNPPFLSLKKDSDIKHVSRVGFVMNFELKNLSLITKIYFTVSGLPRDQLKSFKKKSIWFRKSFEKF